MTKGQETDLKDLTRQLVELQYKRNDIAFEMVKRGHDVTVLTSLPNYPEGRFFKGYGLFRRRKEVVNGVRVIRTWVIPRRNMKIQGIISVL